MYILFLNLHSVYAWKSVCAEIRVLYCIQYRRASCEFHNSFTVERFFGFLVFKVVFNDFLICMYTNTRPTELQTYGSGSKVRRQRPPTTACGLRSAALDPTLSGSASPLTRSPSPTSVSTNSQRQTASLSSSCSSSSSRASPPPWPSSW